MTGDRDIEAELRRHLAAESDELPFLLEAEAVHHRLDQRRGRWWRPLALVPIAAVLILAVAVGEALLASPGGGDRSGGPHPWGPLAVMEMSGGMDALTTGVLRVTDRCVLFETAGGESELLVWPADRTRWDEPTGTIRFTNPPVGDDFTLSDGQPVSFGGGGDATAESGVSGPEWAASVDWVAAPDPSCPMEVRWYVSSVVAVGPTAGANVIVESEQFPGVEIACRGEVYLEADACRSWGDELLGSRPPAADGVTLLVLTANAGNARCAADFHVAQEGPPAATAAVVCPAVPAPSPAPPMQNALEAVIDDSLAVLGLEAERAEYSPTSAFMSVPLEEGAALYVHAFPTGTDGGEFSVLDEHLIAGRTVQRVEYASGPVRDRFECEDVTYEVEGATPPGFASLDAFLLEFIAILGCAAPAGGPDASGAAAELVGVIRGAPDLEGGICPVLLTDAEGEKWEVYLEDPYRREYRGEELVVIGPDGEIVARSGDTVGFNYRREPGMGSFCMAGMPVIATEIVFVESADQ
ncbi:MAG: hypothetical protein M3406_16810 [Chloroflexota bacterium]|nr:hypothetical protein [Chloroflexota bacterium]